MRAGWFGGRRTGAFGRSRSGNVAMMWALMGSALLGLVGLTVDFTRAQSIRAQMQNAVDGAALVAERSAALPLAQRQAAAQAYFNAEMGDLATGTTFAALPLTGGGHRVTASMPMPVSLARLINNHDWTIAVASEAASDTSPNFEVTLILDTTGSMAGSRIADLRTAATGFVDTLLNGNDQTPYYTKIGIVPYSMAVNVGSYANSARGAITPVRTLSNPALNWLNSTARTITAITKGSPCNSGNCTLRVTTSGSHGYVAGDRVYISGVNGMTQLNNQVYIVDNSPAPTSNTFYLNTFPGNVAVNGQSYTNYSSSGTIRRCLTTSCEVVFTANNHGFAANDYVYISGVNGMTASTGQAINNPSPLGTNNPTLWRVGTVVDANRFSLAGSFALNYSAYTSGGSAYCLTAGCEYLRFTNDSSNVRVHRVSTCVSERAGGNAYTDAAPSTTLLGRVYAATGNACPGNVITPLTTNMNTLNTNISVLQASGSTGGHVGVAWGWYLLSPNFSSMLPAGSQPGAYNNEEIVKIAVLMTDGEYNSSYCNGVISGPTSTSGSGSTTDQINCAAPNGHAFDQAQALCAAMKNQGVVVYTVGFQIVNDQRARDLVNDCATDAQHVVMAANGGELIAAFQQIGTAIGHLRITQ